MNIFLREPMPSFLLAGLSYFNSLAIYLRTARTSHGIPVPHPNVNRYKVSYRQNSNNKESINRSSI